MIIPRLISLLLLLTGITGVAQQDARYSQFMYNKVLLNPAVAGTSGLIKGSVFNRNQWVSTETLFRATSVTLDMTVSQNRVGLGWVYEQDNNGIVKQQTFAGAASYAVNWWGGFLRFGIQLGVRQARRDLSDLRIKEENDVLLQDNTSRTNADADFGMFYSRDKLYFGYSVKHLMRPQIGYSVNSLERYNLFHQVMGGAEIQLSSTWNFRPSALIKITRNVEPQVDLVAQFDWHRSFWFGVGARSSRELNVNAGIALHEAVGLIGNPIFLGYGVDFGFNELYSGGLLTHEIMLVVGIRPRPSPDQILKNRKSVNPLFF